MSRVDRLGKAISKLEEAQGILEELNEGVESWRDGLEDTNLIGSQLYDDIEACCDQLDSAITSIGTAMTESGDVEFPNAYGRGG